MPPHPSGDVPAFKRPFLRPHTLPSSPGKMPFLYIELTFFHLDGQLQGTEPVSLLSFVFLADMSLGPRQYLLIWSFLTFYSSISPHGLLKKNNKIIIVLSYMLVSENSFWKQNFLTCQQPPVWLVKSSSTRTSHPCLPGATILAQKNMFIKGISMTK